MNLTWLMRMARWSRRPPSMQHVMIGAVVLAIALAIWGLDAMGWWPDWARVEKMPKPGKLH